MYSTPMVHAAVLPSHVQGVMTTAAESSSDTGICGDAVGVCTPSVMLVGTVTSNKDTSESAEIESKRAECGESGDGNKV